MMNMLALILDFLSDVYFLKRTFNRYCHCTDTPASEVTGDAQIGIAINQIDSFIFQTETGVKTIEDSLINLRLIKTITRDEFIMARKFVSEINEMLEKLHELKWYGTNGDGE